MLICVEPLLISLITSIYLVFRGSQFCLIEQKCFFSFFCFFLILTLFTRKVQGTIWSETAESRRNVHEERDDEEGDGDEGEE